jgi:hypothetical protein
LGKTKTCGDILESDIVKEIRGLLVKKLELF